MNGQRFTKVRQHFPRQTVADIEQAVTQQLSTGKLRFARGARIAVAVGSRGVANIARIAKTVVAWVKAQGGVPFIVPAMGSHGGATSEGQREVLASYGVTEDAMGCPIRSAMDVVELDNGGREFRVFMDRNAHESDGIILINRIKPHTGFHGDYESGLVKMSVIGLGKERMAAEMHGFGVHGLKALMPQASKLILATGKILLGLGIVENAYDETAIIEALTLDEILRREPELLNAAKRLMPRLPLADIDVLIVDRLGKNISGTGMDTKIIGRMRIRGAPDPDFPKIKAIIVTDITDASHGNACGIGLADVTTRRLANKVDWAATYTNVVTGGHYDHGMLPVVAETDAQAVDWGIRTCHAPHEPKKIVRIKDTLHLTELYVSDPALAEIKNRVEMLGAAVNLFDEQGSLVRF